MATQLDEKNKFNSCVLNDEYHMKTITPYTWVFRWQNEREFTLNINENTVEAAKQAIVFNSSEIHRYLKQILENRAPVVYHRAGESKLKHCSDRPFSHGHVAPATPDERA